MTDNLITLSQWEQFLTVWVNRMGLAKLSEKIGKDPAWIHKVITNKLELE